MNIRPLLIVNTILILAMAGISVWAWGQIPDGAQVPVHWNFEGTADRFGSKGEALLLMPILSGVITAIFLVLWRLDPRRKNIEASGKMWNAIGIGVVAFMAYLHTLMVMSALGRHIDMVAFMIPGMSILFIIIGNYLSKTRSNFFAGVRTPWTLSSDYSWGKTHRLAGWLFVATGLAALATWFLLSAQIAIVVLFASLLATTLISVVASYVYWKNDPARSHNAVNGGA